MRLISVIIPVKNGGSTLEKCLTSIKHQTIADEVEIIILDSNSTDNSIKIATIFGAKLINIDPKEFNHGLTRNLGVKYSKGNLLYFTVQDAYLSEDNQLEKMADHFKDQQLEAVVGMQAIPHDKDKNPARWFRRFTKPAIQYRYFPDGTFSKLKLREQFDHSWWDNVNAMYRRTVLIKIPFQKTNISEDWLWARDALSANMKIASDPSLLVYHYHHNSFGYAFRVKYTVNYNFYCHFHIFPGLSPFFIPLLKRYYSILKNPALSAKKKIYWCIHNTTGLLGEKISEIIFLILLKFFSRKILDKSYLFFCRQIPQGRIKKTFRPLIGK